MAPLTDFFRLYISIYPKTIVEQNRSGVPPPQASVATENQSRPVPAPCRRGIFLRWPSSSSRCSPWRGGSSSPLGLRVCTSSYVFDLSLSRVLDLARSWCIASFAIIVGSYVSSTLYSLVMDWVSPLKLSYRIESLKIWEHLMYVLRSTWCMFWWSTCGLRPWTYA